MRLLVFLCATSAFAANPFNGTWKTDLTSVQFPDKPDKVELLNGTYTCFTCAPKVSVKADGTDQRVAGDPRMDNMIVKVIDTRTVDLTMKKGGKVVETERISVDKSSNRVFREITVYPPNSKEPIKENIVAARIEQGPSGSHLISGSWRMQKAENVSSNAVTVTYNTTSEGLSMNDGAGESYTAKFDGKDYPYKGDPSTDSVSLKRIDENTIEETDKRAGKVVGVSLMKVSKDGRSMEVVFENKQQGTTLKFIATKQ